MQLLLLMGFFGCQKGKAKHPAPNCPAPAKGGVKSLLAQVKTIPSHGAVPAASEEAFLERKRAQRRRHKACSVDVLKGSIVHGTWHARCNGAISTALRHIQNHPSNPDVLNPPCKSLPQNRQLLLLLGDPNPGALPLALPSPHTAPSRDSSRVELLNWVLVP